MNIIINVTNNLPNWWITTHNQYHSSCINALNIKIYEICSLICRLDASDLPSGDPAPLCCILLIPSSGLCLSAALKELTCLFCGCMCCLVSKAIVLSSSTTVSSFTGKSMWVFSCFLSHSLDFALFISIYEMMLWFFFCTQRFLLIFSPSFYCNDAKLHDSAMGDLKPLLQNEYLGGSYSLIRINSQHFSYKV